MGIFSRRSKAVEQRVIVQDAAASGAPAGSPAAKETRVFALGAEMLSSARGHKTGVLSAKFYSDWLMEWSMKDPQFKVQMFRFTDAFPMLKTPEAIFDHLTDYMNQPGVNVPPAVATALKAGGLMKGTATAVIANQIKGMAGKFIAGTDAASALPGLKDLWDDSIASSVDLLGEVCVSDEEADAYARKYLDLIQNLPKAMAAWPGKPVLESDHLGSIPRCNVSVKISALSARLSVTDPAGAMADLMRRLLPILETARDNGVFVNFDMEHHELKDFTLDLFESCAAKIDTPLGLAMQAYLKSGVEDARRMCAWAARSKRRITVRLVKGAYWDAETIKSELHGWPCPVWPVKWQTDACFERMTDVFLDATPRTAEEAKARGGVTLALGSHNVRSIAAALAGLEQRNLPRSAIEIQMLHGMADQLKHAAAEMGLRVREYVPVGEMIPGMAYLVRRLLENTSNESWLKAGFMDNADVGALLRSPAPAPGSASPGILDLPTRHALSPAVPGVGDGKPFYTEPLRDFSDKPQREAFAGAIARATVPRVQPDKTPDDAKEMVRRAHEAFPAWRDTDPRVRARVLIEAARLMRRQRDGLAGVMIREAGKVWKEADADVCEAIDFCEYYARVAVPMFERSRLGKFVGELDETFYTPKGVAVIISPWNFPLAICCGMATAALVTGNPVVIKPAEQAMGIASILVDVLHQACASAGVSPALASAIVQFCPGPGSKTGAALVRDPRVALIAFTGSMEVGLDILHAAAPASPFENRAAPTPSHVKHVVCEMGGKNALIIDTSADLDESVLAVRHSAFGYQGQKCSACSRCIVVDEAGPEGPAITTFSRRLAESIKALAIGDPLLPGTDMGPVIDEAAAEKMRGYIERARAGGLRCASVEPPMGDAFVAANKDRFVGPHVFFGVPRDHELAREEIFGPVLAVIHAKTFDEALDIANGSAYKLTGGVMSRKPGHIEKAKREFRVGNLYINRGITGALVGRHPFGGFGMSGAGSKAGGADYLLHFVDPRAVAENTMRRGFAPEL
jgi:RHH-type proline utilization regulon transcriptional repressor/proline dehydrogenase/delta 1-pyrroline-5-carboxylate dehydrogenase